MKKFFALLTLTVALFVSANVANAAAKIELAIEQAKFFPERNEIVLTIGMTNNGENPGNVNAITVRNLRIYDSSKSHVLYDGSFVFPHVRNCYVFPKQTIHVPFSIDAPNVPAHKGSIKYDWDYSVDWTDY